MSKIILDRIDYLIALISEFAKAHKLTNSKAYAYLEKYKGIDFIEEFYDVEHTMSFDDAVDDVSVYCKRMGGNLG